MSDKELQNGGANRGGPGGGCGGESGGWSNSRRWVGYGFELAAVVGLFTYGGWKLDQRLSSSPWCLAGGFTVGFVGMMYLLYKETSDWRK